MNSYRKPEEIIASMLEIAKDSAKKTHIMYGANLSYTLLKKYLNRLMKNELVDYDSSKQRYRLTDKGEEFLDLYRSVEDIEKNIVENTNSLEKKRQDLMNMIGSESEM